MAKEYIERAAALNASKIVYIEYIEVDGEGCEDGNADDIPVVFKKDIEALPAADVAPVVRGRWKPFDLTFGRSIYYCSACEQSEDVPTAMGVPMFRFCPNCGADMKGVDDG